MDRRLPCNKQHALVALGQWLCLLLCLLFSPVSNATEPVRHLAIIINGNSPIHTDFSSTLSRNIQNSASLPSKISIVDIAQPSSRLPDQAADLIVSVGTEATSWSLEQAGNKPQLATLIPQQSYQALIQQHPNHDASHHSAIFIDQPLRRQAELLRLIFPKAKKIGTLLGPGSQSQAARLEQLLGTFSMTLAAAQLGSQDNPVAPLDSILNSSDVFLALPDPAVFNRHSLAGILLTTYRHRVPVIGFSQAYVQAGALAAVYSSADQIAEHTAQQVLALLRQPVPRLPSPTHPAYFSIAINHQVARSLSLELPDAKWLEQRLIQLEQDQP